jgi:hypothetical protein
MSPVCITSIGEAKEWSVEVWRVICGRLVIRSRASASMAISGSRGGNAPGDEGVLVSEV